MKFSLRFRKSVKILNNIGIDNKKILFGISITFNRGKLMDRTKNTIDTQIDIPINEMKFLNSIKNVNNCYKNIENDYFDNIKFVINDEEFRERMYMVNQIIFHDKFCNVLVDAKLNNNQTTHMCVDIDSVDIIRKI